MPRRYDADLCRHKVWEPGTMLRFEETDASTHYYVLTAVGRRAILVCGMYPKRVDSFRVPGEFVLGKESKLSGQLYRCAIQRFGTWDFETGTFVLDEGTPEFDELKQLEETDNA